MTFVVVLFDFSVCVISLLEIGITESLQSFKDQMKCIAQNVK